MTRARPARVLLMMLAVAMLALLCAHGARATAAHSAGPVDVSAQALSCDHSTAPEEMSGHFWTRNRLNPDDVPAPQTGSDAPSPVAVPASTSPRQCSPMSWTSSTGCALTRASPHDWPTGD